MRHPLICVFCALGCIFAAPVATSSGASDLMGSLTSQIGGAASSQLADAVAPASSDSPLIGALTSQLGVTEDQAAEGSGAIFGLAKNRMSPADFLEVSDAVPGIDSLIAAAPAGGASSGGGMLGAGGALGALGALGGTGTLGNLAGLAGPYSDLGMSPDMVTKFVPVILDYVQSTGGDAVMGLLKNGLM